MMVKFLVILTILLWSTAARANPYLPKPGEKTLSMRVSTCAVSGGFVHLYTALDYGLFDKYGIKLDNIFIRGSARRCARPPAPNWASPPAKSCLLS